MFLAPMLLEKREDPFNDERYVFEPKIDGHRMIISIENGKVQLFTRHNNEVTRNTPSCTTSQSMIVLIPFWTAR
jgi:DNA ligase-1